MNTLVFLITSSLGQFGNPPANYEPGYTFPYNPRSKYTGRADTSRRDININQNYSGGYGPVDRATARRMDIENWRLYVETRWDLQDEAKERRKHELSYNDRLERRVEALERNKALNDRYKQLTGKNP